MSEPKIYDLSLDELLAKWDAEFKEIKEETTGMHRTQEKHTASDTEVDAIIAEFLKDNRSSEPAPEPRPILSEYTSELPDESFLHDSDIQSSEPDAVPQDAVLPEPALEETPVVFLEEAAVALQPQEISPPYPKPRRWLNRIGNSVFWMALIAAFFTVLIYSAGGSGRNLFGFTIFEVLTDSMQSEIPQGSLVLVRETDAEALKIGDDITFLVDEKNTYTHRIIGIYENYEDSGQIGFETWGIENPLPDKEIVFAENVIGKVVWHLPGVGKTLDYISENWLVILLFAAGLIIMVFLLKIVFSKDKDEKLGKKRKRRFKKRKEVTEQ